MITSVFLFLFLVSILISVLIYQRTNQEVYLILAVLSGISAFILGLTLVHWSIHLLTLIALVCFPIPIYQGKTINISDER